jgi:DNA polymerase-3 subunit delta'
VSSVWDRVVGQPAAVARLRASVTAPVHAYLFVGPPGSTKAEAARAFAALLLTGVDDPDLRSARLALRGEHPDVHEIVRTGPAISADQARDIIHVTSLAPVEDEHKVVVLHDFHLLTADAAARLLKSIEEPPPSTTFLVLADHVPADLVTIASRCVRIDFGAISETLLVEQLIAEDFAPEDATTAAAAAGGNLDRARLLAADPTLAERRRAFAELPSRLDGTGAAVMRATDELLEHIEQAAAPLAERHAAEVAELDARIARIGERGSGRKLLEERHRRELRRHLTDELRSGLGVLAGAYRDRLVSGGGHRPEALVDAVTRIHGAVEALERNANEHLLLQSLFWSLPIDD